MTDYVERQITKILIRISEDPGDVRRLLAGLAAALELVAERIPPAKEGDHELVWTPKGGAQ